MKTTLLALLSLFSLVSIGSAAVFGTETFDSDGLIAGQTGGTGFDYDNINSTHTGTVSDWDNTGGTPSVVGGALSTQGTSAKREHNGPTEGSGGGDGPDTERAGALRGSGVVFYRFDITRSSGSTWSGASSYDFGSEKVFFGVHGGLAASDQVGIQISGGASTSSGISIADGTTHTLISVLDFDNDLLGIWVDPDATDDWDAIGGTADATLAYTAGNWSTALRFGSGGSGATTWDNLTIADTAADVGLLGIPEPSSALLGAFGLVAFFLRRRR